MPIIQNSHQFGNENLRNYTAPPYKLYDFYRVSAAKDQDETLGRSKYSVSTERKFSDEEFSLNSSQTRLVGTLDNREKSRQAIGHVIEKRSLHSVPKSFIKELGIEASAVLLGFALVLKNHKSNLSKGLYWYYDTLDALIAKRWPYLKRSTLYTLVQMLGDKKLIQISKSNKKGYDRTIRYAMHESRIDEVIGDTRFLFDIQIARKVGVLGALIHHNLAYQISKQVALDEKRELNHKPVIRKLASAFFVSSSTVRRTLDELVSNANLKNYGGGYYGIISESESLEATETPEKKCSNLDLDIPKGSKISHFCRCSNLDEKCSFLDEKWSNLDEKCSDLDDNTICETDVKLFEKQMRSAPRAFFERNFDELNSCYLREVSSEGNLLISDSRIQAITSISEKLIELGVANSTSSAIAECLHNCSKIPLACPLDSIEIHDSGLTENGKENASFKIDKFKMPLEFSEYSNEELGISDLPINYKEGDLEIDVPMNDSELEIVGKGKKEKLDRESSFGRSIGVPKSEVSRFLDLTLENSKLNELFFKLEVEKQTFIKDSLLRLSVRFIESLDLQTRTDLLEESSPNSVLSNIAVKAFEFLEEHSAEFHSDHTGNLSEERYFPFLPFMEILVRGIFLYADTSSTSLFEFDEFEVCSIFESLSSGSLSIPYPSPEIKVAFFSYLILRAKVFGFDPRSSFGDLLKFDRGYFNKIVDYISCPSDSDFKALLGLFRDKASLSAEEVYFKYMKAVEFKLSSQVCENEFDDFWHLVNFKNIPQLVRFYSSIETELREGSLDFHTAWNRD